MYSRAEKYSKFSKHVSPFHAFILTVPSVWKALHIHPFPIGLANSRVSFKNLLKSKLPLGRPSLATPLPLVESVGFLSLVFLFCNPVISCAYLLTELFPLWQVVSLRVGIVSSSSLKCLFLVQWLAKNKILERRTVDRGDDVKYPTGSEETGPWVSALGNADLRGNCFRE